jgi:hypothetical protein
MVKQTIARRKLSTLEQQTRKFIRAKFIRRRNQLRARGCSCDSDEEIVEWPQSEIFVDIDVYAENKRHRNPNLLTLVADSSGNLWRKVSRR